MVDIRQVDRDAAIEYAFKLAKHLREPRAITAQAMHNGELHKELSEAFARHRIAAIDGFIAGARGRP